MRHRGARMAVCSAWVALAAGCSMGPDWASPPEPLRASRAAREREITRAWEGHPLRELVDAWGPPRLLLDIPGGGNPPGYVLVYPRDGDTGCVDTFAVTYGEVVRVRSYQCR